MVAIEGKCALCEREIPQPGADEILVKVKACGINRLDVIQRMGKAKPPPGVTDVLGLEIAGEVVGIGTSTSSPFEIGDRVMCLVSGGGYADFAIAPISTSMKIPSNISWEIAGFFKKTKKSVYNYKYSDIFFIYIANHHICYRIFCVFL